MRFLLGLAWKNLSRYKKRTMITASAIAVGLGIFIFLDSWLLGMEQESERNLIWYESSYARIMNDEYWEEKDQLPLEYVIEDPDAVVARLTEMKIPAAARIVFGGELIIREDPFEQDGSMPVKIYAIDPGNDDNVFRFRETITAGRYLEPGEDSVLMGSWLAEDLGAQIGFPITIITTTRDGYYQTLDLIIAGIVNCPNPVVNRSSIFIPLDTADFYLEMRGAVTEINLKFPQRADAELMAAEINDRIATDFAGLEVLSWKILAKDYVALATTKQSGTRMILFLVFIIAAVGVSNTMLMAIYERVRELGMMRALGMKRSQIRLAFLFEAGGIGFIGSVLGMLLGAALCFWIVKWGVDYSAMTRDMDIGYRVAGIMRGAWNPAAFVQAFFFGILLSVAVAFIPTRRALKMSITSCLRDQ
ncbi:MAG TPA: ABC transporter permease [Spirochaetes bacterium]|nr:ABC transporter permease [Spirochaetota bacterium]